MASKTTFGHVKVGSGINVEDGVISVDEMTASNVTTTNGSNVQTELDNLKSDTDNKVLSVKSAIVSNGGTISQAGEVPTARELVDGVNSLPISTLPKEYKGKRVIVETARAITYNSALLVNSDTSDDQRYFYFIANTTGDVYRYDLTDFTLVNLGKPVGKVPSTINVSGDGNVIYITDNANKLYRYKISDAVWVDTTITTVASNSSVQYESSDDGTVLIYINAGQQLVKVIFNSDGSKTSSIISTATAILNYSRLQMDKNMEAYALNGNGYIIRVNIITGVVTTLIASNYMTSKYIVINKDLVGDTLMMFINVPSSAYLVKIGMDLQETVVGTNPNLMLGNSDRGKYALATYSNNPSILYSLENFGQIYTLPYSGLGGYTPYAISNNGQRIHLDSKMVSYFLNE